MGPSGLWPIGLGGNADGRMTSAVGGLSSEVTVGNRNGGRNLRLRGEVLN